MTSPTSEAPPATKILVVEDDPNIVDLIRSNLAVRGFETLVSTDGSRVLQTLETEQPDLILLDLMLPQLSGTEVTRIIRRESDVPILILTARGSEVDKVVGLELGADDYVTKPFSLRELQARIRGILRRSERPAGAVGGDATDTLRVGRATIDLAGHRLLRDGDVRPVKPKAFDLLAFLLRHQGQVFSREQLLADVWGYDYAGETRTVDVHVHWLRAEIEDDPQNPKVLETVRGVGYVLRRQP